MRKTIIPFITAAMLASCGGSQQNSNSNNQENDSNGNSQAELNPASAEIIHKAFNKLIVDHSATQRLETEGNYDFGNTFCNYNAEMVSGARAEQVAGNYTAMGCFQKKDGDVLVVKYELIQHWNGHSMGNEPEVTFFNYSPGSESFEEIKNQKFLVIDSADFWMDNDFVRFGNEIYFTFNEESIMMNLTSTEFPEQTYKWNGEKFVKQPVDASEMASAHTDDSQIYIPVSAFVPTQNDDKKGTVTDKKGNKEAELHYSDRSGIKSVSIYSPKYWVNGTGVGSNISDINKNRAPEDQYEISTGSDGCKIATRNFSENTAIMKADKSGKIKEIEIIYKNEKDAADMFNVPDNSEIDATGRKILKLIAAQKPFEIYGDVAYKGATTNTAIFSQESPSGEWDNTVFYEHQEIRFGYYKMTDGKYIAYIQYYLAYDEMDEKDLRYTPKKEYGKKAYIIDGENIKETQFNIPCPGVEDMPSSYELDPVPVYLFDEHTVTIKYDCNVNLFDIMDEYDGEDQPSSSRTYNWTGNGWQEDSQE